MGNDQSNPIRNLDKRTARREYRTTFGKAIAGFQQQNSIYPYGEDFQVGENLEEDGQVLDFEKGAGNVRVLVRKRPIFEHEESASEFDVVSCVDGKTAIIHDTRMHADMRRMMMSNHFFDFDGVFNENATNDNVYASACRPLVTEAVNGGFATVCVYGQTGSGKSFTMTSFYEKAAHEIFAELDRSNDRMYVNHARAMFRVRGLYLCSIVVIFPIDCCITNP